MGIENLFGDLSLGAYGIKGEDTPADIQAGESRWNRRHLIALVCPFHRY